MQHYDEIHITTTKDSSWWCGERNTFIDFCAVRLVGFRFARERGRIPKVEFKKYNINKLERTDSFIRDL